MIEKFNSNFQSSGGSGRFPVAARALTIGGPTSLLPDIPENLVKFGKFNKSIPLIVGTTRDDGSYIATG